MRCPEVPRAPQDTQTSQKQTFYAKQGITQLLLFFEHVSGGQIRRGTCSKRWQTLPKWGLCRTTSSSCLRANTYGQVCVAIRSLKYVCLGAVLLCAAQTARHQCAVLLCAALVAAQVQCCYALHVCFVCDSSTAVSTCCCGVLVRRAQVHSQKTLMH
jgi:hypothetical protein